MTGSPQPLRSAEIIAVGSEMLGSTRVDTNSLFLAERLAALGIALRAKTVVGDRRIPQRHVVVQIIEDQKPHPICFAAASQMASPRPDGSISRRFSGSRSSAPTW